MKSNNLAVIVPVDERQNGDSLKTQVWGVVTDLLTKYLGKYYGSFFPVQKAWDSKIKNAYGVVLGIEDPLNFLNLLAEAKQKQQNAMAFHMGFLFKEIEKADTGEHVIPIFLNKRCKRYAIARINSMTYHFTSNGTPHPNQINS